MGTSRARRWMFSKLSRCQLIRHCAAHPTCSDAASRRVDSRSTGERWHRDAQSIRAALLEGTIRNAVNMPNLDAKTLAIIGPHLRFGEKLGRFLSQIAPKRVESLNINYSGKVNGRIRLRSLVRS
jgi:hypothetical protein